MYLKRLEMQGFKSFADKTVLEFMPGITTVIGPNGSGKSNISDCIRWILGEQSMKSLRGSKAEDIIFAGTQNRKSLGFAEGSIVIDNTDGKLPIEYSEVIVTRRIYRSGESGYFINKTPCRLKDILELFMDTGIGKDGYSIIGQGKIDEILSNKSEDRRHIFEEAAGIVKYRTRKVEAEKKLEQTKLNLLRINDILAEIETNIEPLKIQSEKAKKFLDLREELKKVEISLFIHNIENYKNKIKEALDDEDVYNVQLVKEAERLNNIQFEKEELKQKIDELIEEIEKAQNIGFENEKKKEQFNSEISINKERINNNTLNFERYDKEIEESNKRISELEDEKNQKNSKKENLALNKEKFEKELAEKEELLAECTKKLSDKELEIEVKKKTLEENIDKKYEISEQISNLKVNKENFEKREKALKGEITSTISELDESRLQKEEINKGFLTYENKRNEILKKLDSVKDKKEESVTKIKDYETKINMLSSDYRIKESKYKFLVEMEKEKEGYIKSVKSILVDSESNASLKKGMHGVLANLISVPKEYETAIEMTLGNTMQNIVTDTEEDAKKLVEYLRKNSLGRASFLPISAVKGKKLEKMNTSGIKNVVGIASDLIKFDKKYEQIVLNLLGRTVIVEDMDTAIALARKNSYGFRIVTLDGDLINPSGAISGGSNVQKTNNIFGRTREISILEKELKDLQSKIEKVEKEKSDYENSIKDILLEVENYEKELQEFEIVYATEKQKVISKEEAIAKIETTLAKLRKEVEDINLQKQEIENRNKSLSEEISKMEEINKNLNIEISEFAALNKDNQKYIDDLNFDITNLKISVSSFDESETSLEEILDRINTEIENNKQSIQNKEEQKNAILEANKEIELAISKLEEEIKKLAAEVTGSGEKVESLKKERTQKNEKLDKTEKEIEELQSKVEDLKTHINKIEVKKSKLEIEMDQIITRMWEDYELTPNQVQNVEKLSNPSEVQKKVNLLRNDIKELGSINIDSIKEYKELKERYDFMCEQRLDLENSSNKLKKVISEMTDTMKEQFEKQFKIINKNFGEVFTELFGGGKAELILADKENILECGIEIEVQPPGKKLQNMMLLSGGERAFTAIALLFAILKINPAPFCVLDEIEAALDDVNVYRFAEYLKKFTKETQFLVITHRKGTMEAADTVYGITMEEKGISKLLSMKFK